MLLTVERHDDDTVEIYGDEQGLAHLIQRLEVIKEHGGHEHLMSPAWGGWELSEQVQGSNNTLIDHLVIVKSEASALTPSP